MKPTSQPRSVSEDYLRTLERVKEQYQQYVEVSELYKLPIGKAERTIKYVPPSPERPLNWHRFRR